MRILTLLIFFTAPNAFAGGPSGACPEAPSLKALRTSTNAEDRSRAGVCLVRTQISQAVVARSVLQIIRDPKEDILLREDLMEAFAESSLRRKIRIEGRLAPEMGEEEKQAMDRNVGSVGSILAAAQGVKSIEETLPVTSYESDFFHALSELALDESSHVLLRASAVNALERLSLRVVGSGVYDEKNLRLARETLRTVASREDSTSYFTNAASAYSRLASAGLPGFSREVVAPTRMLSSVKVPSGK